MSELLRCDQSFPVCMDQNCLTHWCAAFPQPHKHQLNPLVSPHVFYIKFISCVRPSEAKRRARPGFEPGTSRTLSENHTPRPTSHAQLSTFVLWLGPRHVIEVFQWRCGSLGFHILSGPTASSSGLFRFHLVHDRHDPDLFRLKIKFNS